MTRPRPGTGGALGEPDQNSTNPALRWVHLDAYLRADSAMRFECMVQRLIAMPKDNDRRTFLQLVEDRHDADLRKLGAHALKAGLAYKLRLEVWRRMQGGAGD